MSMRLSKWSGGEKACCTAISLRVHPVKSGATILPNHVVCDTLGVDEAPLVAKEPECKILDGRTPSPNTGGYVWRTATTLSTPVVISHQVLLVVASQQHSATLNAPSFYPLRVPAPRS